MPPHQLLYFGGQTLPSGPHLRQLLDKGARSAVLNDFFNQAVEGLRAETRRVGHEDGQAVPQVRSVLELAQKCEEESTGGDLVVLSTVALYLAQMGDYILRTEAKPELFTPPRRALGVCTGLLPAMVAAVSSSTGQLVDNALRILNVALRLSIHAMRRSHVIERGRGSWSVAFSVDTAGDIAAALQEFSNDHPLPPTSRAYISAQSPSSLTVSGPPSTLGRFLASPALAGLKTLKLPVHAAFHAPHLARVDAPSLASSLSMSALSLCNGSLIYSCSTGAPYSGETVEEILPQVIDDIFTHKLMDFQAVRGLLEGLDAAEEHSMSIFGPANASGLRRVVEQQAASSVTLQTLEDMPYVDSEGDAIAVIGMSGRYPGSENLQHFWESLARGDDLCQQVPEDRFRSELHVDPSGQDKNRTTSAYGCFLDRPGAFDHRLFNMSPREAKQTDPGHRLLLMATYEALDMAGYNGAANRGPAERVGSFVSLAADDWREHNASQDIDVYYITGGLRAFGAGRLNYFFKWEGPSFTVDTACSSGSAAIQLAFEALRRRDCDMAVVGGANVMTGPSMYAGLSRAGFLSPTGSSKTFDDTADGYCRGEAASVLVLKRLDTARAQRDNVLGVIRAATTNHSAHASSITHPHAPAQMRLYEQAFRMAGVEPRHIGYVEAHGTGTQAGDTKEMESIFNTFAQGRTAQNPLYVGGVKSNIGHGEAAAGITSVIKALLMLKAKSIPPHAGIKTRLNRKFPPLEAAHIRVATEVLPFERVFGPRRVLVNSFGASGGNTCVIVEEAASEIMSSVAADCRTHHVVAASAKSQASLNGNVNRLLKYVQSNPQAHLRDIAYTSTSRRIHHPLRVVFEAASIEELVQKLALNSSPSASTTPSTTAFLFPGQGMRIIGFAKQLYSTCEAFQDIIVELDKLSVSLGNPSFLPVLLDEGKEGTVVSQIAIVALEIALFRLLKRWNITPSVVIGHSLGEYAALCAAGVLSASDTLFLVGKRAELLETLCSPGTHGMISLNASAEQCAAALHGQDGTDNCAVACLNSPQSTVISGPLTELQTLRAALGRRTAGIKCSVVATEYAFHSAQLDPICEEYHKIASMANFSKPTLPIASTLLGELVREDDALPFSASYLVDQARKPVEFAAALRACEESGLINRDSLLLEVGPGKMCLSMARLSIDSPGEPIACLSSPEAGWDSIARVVSSAYTHGHAVNWTEYHRPFEDGLHLLDLPSYDFDLSSAWIQNEGGTARLQKEIARLQQELDAKTAPQESASPTPVPVVPPPPISSCLDSIETQNIAPKDASIVFLADIQRKPLRDLIKGHNVIGMPLVPSSIYAEMAYTATKHLYSKLHPRAASPALSLENFSIVAPLILSEEAGSQMVKVTVHMETNATSATLSIRSSKDHAKCTVNILSDGEKWSQEWTRRDYLMREKVERLLNPREALHAAHHLRRDMIYKIFCPVTTYAAEYQSNAAAFIDDSFEEAATLLDLRETPPSCSFTFDPCWVDGLAQAAGFMINASPSKPDDVLYVSTGWESMRLSQALSPGQYSCYVRSRSCQEGTIICDVVLLSESAVLAVVDGFIFKRVKKSQLLGLFEQARTATNQGRKPSTKPVEEAVAEQPSSRNADSGNTAKPYSSSVPEDSLFFSVVNIVADEVCSSAGDFADETTLESLGMDSLLTVSLTSRLKAELGIELPASLLSGPTTIADLRTFFAEIKSQQTSDGRDCSDDSSVSPSYPLTPATPALQVGIVQEFISAVADEMGVEEHEVSDRSLLAELGIDSLMSISIIGTIRDRTGVDLPASFLTDFSTICEAKAALLKKYGHQDEISTTQLMATTKRAINHYCSNVVLLQGDSSSGKPKLFLISEGSGSAAAYIHLPNLQDQVTVYGLESPFLHCPEEFDYDMEEVCSVYVRAIKTAQPRGPYLLGGWSIGGMYAYETSRQLIVTGEEVHGLLLIDSACPRRLEGIPPITIDVCEETGMFHGMANIGKNQPLTRAQKQHVVGCVKAVADYEPIPVPEESRPSHSFVIWSRFGLFDKLALKVKEVGDLRAEEQGLEKTGVNQDWLTAERTSFGPKGWDRLLGDVECFSLDGDHFSIMMLPKIKTHTGVLLAQLVRTMTAATQEAAASLSLSQGNICDIFRSLEGRRLELEQSAGCADFTSRVYPIQRRLVLAYVVEALAKLGVDLSELPKGTALEVKGVLPKHKHLLNAMYEILSDANLTEYAGSGKAVRTSQPVDTDTASTIHKEIIRESPPHSVSHRLLQVIGDNLADCLAGKEDPMAIVFGRNRDIINEFYAHAPEFAAASHQLCEFLHAVYRIAQPTTAECAPFEILEIGAGLGGTTRHVLKMLTDCGIAFRYTFTDISQSLVTAAKKRFTKAFPDVAEYLSFATLDITKEIPSSFNGRFHTVISTNCIHATEDLQLSTANIRRMLRPNGFLALIELTTRLFWLDIVFGFFDGWWLFTDGRKHALADEKLWEKALQNARYSHVLWVEDIRQNEVINPQLIVAINS